MMVDMPGSIATSRAGSAMGGGGSLEESEFERGPMDWPDTDSEFGDHAAARAARLNQPRGPRGARV